MFELFVIIDPMMKMIHLLSIIVPLSLFLWLLTPINSSNRFEMPTLFRWFWSLSLSFVVSLIGYTKKSLNLSGFVFALVFGITLTLSNYCFMASLLMFFISSSKATKYRTDLKRNLEEDFREGGQRNWIQVICNGGVATQLSLCYLLETGSKEVPIDFITQYNISWFAISILGAFSCANGDTWASELGAVLTCGDPLLITSLRRVPKGTNGGISFMGLLMSALGGLAVGLAFYIPIFIFSNSEDYNQSPPQLVPILIVSLFAGLFGSIIDSILGATLQYSGIDMKTGKIVENSGKYVKRISGTPFLDNHSVNLISNLITAIITPYFAIRLWTYI